jgi:clan AA aspartic protease
MGTFSVSIEFSDLNGGRRETLEALVDTGSSYSFIPRPVLNRLGISPIEQMPFRLANEERVFYDIGWAAVRFEDRAGFTLVVFGEPDAMPLMGSHTLESLRLSVDPVNKRLVPIDGLLK